MIRRRICFIGWANHVHLERWAGYFATLGHEVSVISFTEKGRYPEGVRQYVVGLKGRGLRWIELKLRWLLYRIKPEMVHVHWAHFAVPVRKAWSGPLVVTAWGSDIYKREMFDDEQWRTLALALNQSQLVTCDSEDIAHAICAELGVPSRIVRVIQWGVDTTVFSPDGVDLRAELGLVDREVVLSPRNFTPLYNQDRILAAFAMLQQRRPQAFLLMKNYGGDPEVIAAIQRDIEVRGLQDKVRILDTMRYEEMPALYRTADVTVSIPSSDATPMSLLEAMASGSPVVVGDLPSLREWVCDRETGCVVNHDDITHVAQAMHDILADRELRARLIRNARELVCAQGSQRFHMEVANKCYEELIR